MVSIDLKDAYLSVPVTQEDRHFLRFMWDGTLYEFQCLPFGLSSAPRVFTKLLKPVVALLRRRGIRCILFLDDMLIMDRDISAKVDFGSQRGLFRLLFGTGEREKLL